MDPSTLGIKLRLKSENNTIFFPRIKTTNERTERKEDFIIIIENN